MNDRSWRAAKMLSIPTADLIQMRADLMSVQDRAEEAAKVRIEVSMLIRRVDDMLARCSDGDVTPVPSLDGVAAEVSEAARRPK